MCDHFQTKAGKIRNLKYGKGLQYILDEAYRILGNPILAHDMEYRLLAYNKNAVNDDPIWNEFATNGTVSPSWLEFFKNETFFDMAAYAKKVAYLPSDRLKYERILGKIYTKYHILVGFVVIHACDKPFVSSDIELFKIVCDKISKELSNDDFYQSYGQTYREALISKLIEGSINDRRLYVAQIEDIYDGLKLYLHLLVVYITKCKSGYTQLEYFRDLFMQTEPAFKYSIYSNNIIIILSTNKKKLYAKKDLKKLYTYFEEYNLFAGISRGFENLFELKRHYNEAVSALNVSVSPVRTLPAPVRK